MDCDFSPATIIVNLSQYRLTSGGEFIDLPIPEPGNTEGEMGDKIVHQTSGGKTLYTDVDRPKQVLTKYRFKILSRKLKEKFVAFYQKYNGALITVLDHEGRTREGVFTDDELEIITIRDNLYYELSFGFLEVK